MPIFEITDSQEISKNFPFCSMYSIEFLELP